MRIGVSLRIDVSKIEKARLFIGEKGKYLDCTAFIDIDQKGQYGDNGMITQDVTKEEREAKVNGPILGNVKVFYRDDSGQQQQGSVRESPMANNPRGPQYHNTPPNDFDGGDDFPF